MTPNPVQKSSTGKNSPLKNGKRSKESTSIITVRIDEELNTEIDKAIEKIGNSKANFIRNYLNLSKYVILQNKSIRSYNDSDLIVIKKSHLRKLIVTLEEEEQIELGIKIARFINNIATIQGKSKNIEYKLDLCEHLGFFNKFIDEERYILFSKKFGPKKFVEAFVYKIINEPKFQFDPRYTTVGLSSSKSLKQKYDKEINPIETRSYSHYAFGFARLPELPE